MGFHDHRRFPDFAYISPSLEAKDINAHIDLVLISHFHLDHVGSQFCLFRLLEFNYRYFDHT